MSTIVDIPGAPPIANEAQAREVAAGAAQGLSTRAIGAALGVGVATVHRDREATVPDGTVEPVPIKGMDGRDYAPSVY